MRLGDIGEPGRAQEALDRLLCGALDLGPFFSSRTSRERAVTPRISSVSRRGVQYSWQPS